MICFFIFVLVTVLVVDALTSFDLKGCWTAVFGKAGRELEMNLLADTPASFTGTYVYFKHESGFLLDNQFATVDFVDGASGIRINAAVLGIPVKMFDMFVF